MAMLLLVSTLSLLVISALAHPHRNPDNSLNFIIEEAKVNNESLIKEFFVEDVRPLVEAGCEDIFFCKVYNILNERNQPFDSLVKNLKTFINQTNVNCSALPTPPTGVTIQLPELMRLIITCAQRRNLTKGRKPHP